MDVMDKELLGANVRAGTRYIFISGGCVQGSALMVRVGIDARCV